MFKTYLYKEENYALWNDFVGKAKNATFLFHRDFIEYHKQRFYDYSLMVFDEKNNLQAIVAAHLQENKLYSHNGLTYGGIVVLPETKFNAVLKIVQSICVFLIENNFETFYIKDIPEFYTKLPSKEFEYIYHLLQAKLYRKEIISVISLNEKLPMSRTRKQGINSSKNMGYDIKKENDFNIFFNELLLPHLHQKHQATPVHTVQELTYLQNKFPENIEHYNVYLNEKLVAGTTLFITENVAKAQYIATIPNYSERNSLDVLYYFLLEKYKHKKYFDFGPSHQENGRKIQEAILFWKESFGARAAIQNYYEINLNNYKLLNSIFI